MAAGALADPELAASVQVVPSHRGKKPRSRVLESLSGRELVVAQRLEPDEECFRDQIASAQVELDHGLSLCLTLGEFPLELAGTPVLLYLTFERVGDPNGRIALQDTETQHLVAPHLELCG
jgi:hypothetical protein